MELFDIPASGRLGQLDTTNRSPSPAVQQWLVEKAKWDAYYSTLPLVEADAATEGLNRELIERVLALLPEGGRVLEAGCGGGWQSLALARTGRFETSLLDFSTEALSYAARLFEREALPAHYIEADIAVPGSPEFDLVFNAGVLEHYTFEEQLSLVRGMKSRSRQYVLVLVPNKRCYWYWVWRMARSANGEWPWGKEIPSGSLAAVFEKAGVHFLGQAYLGKDWIESFISELTGSNILLREQILSLHRSPLLPIDTRSYLLAALGSVCAENKTLSGWVHKTVSEEESTEVLTAALADALAIRNAEATELQRLQRVNSENESAWRSDVQQFAKERELSLQEKRTLLRTINAITAQAGELLAERRREFQQRDEIHADIAALREEKGRLLSENEKLSKFTSHLEANAKAEQERFSSILKGLHENGDSICRQNAVLLDAVHDLTAVLQELGCSNQEFRNMTERLRADLHDREMDLFQRQTEKESLERTLAEVTEQRVTEGQQTRTIQATLAEITSGHDALARELVNLQERFSREKELSERTSARIAEERDASEQHVRTLQSALAESRSAHNALARESSALQERFAEITEVLSQKEAQIVSERALSHESSRQLRNLRRRTLIAATRFEAAFHGLFEEVRGQRAWRVMVAIRKAYTLWTRRGLRGKLSTLGVPFQLISRHHTFRKYDLTFPNIWDYLQNAIESSGQENDDIGATTTPTTEKFDVIILPVFDFEFRFQRPQQIASEFARSGHRVFWVSPTRFLQPRTSELFESVLLRDNLHEVRLSGDRLNLYTDALPTERAEEMEHSLIELYRKRALAETVVIVQFPFWRQVALRLRRRFGARVVYDCMDDWRNWTVEPRISEFSLTEERELSRECDVLAATSAELHKRLEAETGRRALRLRNGVDYDFFRAAAQNDLLAGVQHPIIGYYGAIADWVNLELIADVAALRPQYSFVFIGEVHSCDVSRLQQLPNVRMLGEKHYRVIPSYLYNFDVCILPFVENQLTRSVDPVKVYEYLSQGKPVVATPLPEVRDHGQLVYLAGNPMDFAAQMDRALTEPDAAVRSARVAYAESNSWTIRAKHLASAISDIFPLVSIIVVSHNSREYLEPFLDSVRRNTAYPHFELIIVDNKSTDGSQDLLRQYEERYPKLRTLLLDRNLGFAGGNNVAAREAKGDYLVLVNADTILTWGWLERLLRPLRADPQIGVTAPVTNFSGNETRVNTEYRTLPEMDQFARERATREFGRTFDLEMAPLLCTAMPRRVWEECGELDEKFGIGMFEDDDFCLRVKAGGYRIVAVEDCFIHHFGNGSFGKLPSGEALRLFEQNRVYFESKWNIQWAGHRVRPGVQPLTAQYRLQLREFLQVGGVRTIEKAAPLILKRLLPEQTTVGQPINKQSDGSSALVVECENATPGTVIRFGSALVHTAYGSQGLLSAILAADFNAEVGNIAVSLVNDLSESNTLIFRIEKGMRGPDSSTLDHSGRS